MRWCVLLVVLVGCGVESPPEDDAGTTTRLDAGGHVDAGPAAVLDAGNPVEPVDASIDVIDAGLSFDASVSSDAGDKFITDAGTLPACSRCNSYNNASNAGTVMAPGLNELSGLVASQAHPGVLYAHNDSGGRAAIFIMSTTGADLGELVLTGAMNADWEDLAIGPCPTGTCLYVGEIGDNSYVNPGPYAVYRVAEPNVTASASIGSVSVSSERFELRYPNDEKFNAETLMVHPVTGDVYVVTKPELKIGNKASAYKATAPLSTSSRNDLFKLATLKIPETVDTQVTGGSIDPCGKTMLIRTYTNMYQYTLSDGASFDSIFSTLYNKVPAPVFNVQEKQGEAVSYATGGGYYTVSEGSSPMLHFFGCK